MYDKREMDKTADVGMDAEVKPVTYKPGGKSLKSLTLKAFPRGCKRPHVTRLRAPNGNAFHEMGEQDILEQFARGLEKAYPLDEFRMVKVARDTYNFISDGAKA